VNETICVEQHFALPSIRAKCKRNAREPFIIALDEAKGALKASLFFEYQSGGTPGFSFGSL
jgi:hypothetical protein